MTASVARTVCSALEVVEDFKLPYVRFSVFLKAICVAAPVGVLLYDTSSLWMPKSVPIPIISWFQRRWRTDPELQINDLQTIRNGLFFAFMVVLFMNNTTSSAVMPSDYLEQRMTNTNAVKAAEKKLYAARNAAFQAAGSVIGEEEMNITSAQQQRDVALRRRYLRSAKSAQ